MQLPISCCDNHRCLFTIIAAHIDQDSVTKNSKLEGFLSIKGNDFFICVEADNFWNCDEQSLGGDLELRLSIAPKSLFAAADFASVGDVSIGPHFLTALSETLQKYLYGCAGNAAPLAKSILTAEEESMSRGRSRVERSRVEEEEEEDSGRIEELLAAMEDELGWDAVAHVAPDFASVELRCRDCASREHRLRVTRPLLVPSSSSPLVAPLPRRPLVVASRRGASCDYFSVEADLPRQYEKMVQNSAGVGGLVGLHSRWRDAVDALQPFWAALDALDLEAAASWSADEAPRRKCATRTILLENEVIVRMEVSLRGCGEAPKCRLVGPKALVAPLKPKLVRMYQDWDENESIVVNTERCLGVDVVRRPHAHTPASGSRRSAPAAVECAVCYDAHLYDERGGERAPVSCWPDATCDHCRKRFHLACLYRWLHSLPSSRQSAQFIRGQCPYCTKIVSCAVPTS